jgi:hypothetical protein
MKNPIKVFFESLQKNDKETLPGKRNVKEPNMEVV